jgi:hypothetical protein
MSSPGGANDMEIVTRMAEVIAVLMSAATAAMIYHDSLKFKAAGAVRGLD